MNNFCIQRMFICPNSYLACFAFWPANRYFAENTLFEINFSALMHLRLSKSPSCWMSKNAKAWKCSSLPSSAWWNVRGTVLILITLILRVEDGEEVRVCYAKTVLLITSVFLQGTTSLSKILWKTIFQKKPLSPSYSLETKIEYLI